MPKPFFNPKNALDLPSQQYGQNNHKVPNHSEYCNNGQKYEFSNIETRFFFVSYSCYSRISTIYEIF